MPYVLYSMQQVANMLLENDVVDPDDYQLQRLAWRRSQTDSNIRALAYDYKVGLIDDCTTDAWAEYQLRFGEESYGPNKEYPKGSPRSRARRSSKRKRKVA